jgi:hypothetical protein
MIDVVRSKAKADCAVTAFASWFGITYEEVLIDLSKLAMQTGFKFDHTKWGTSDKLSEIYLFKRGLMPRNVPRRGQEKLTCIASMHSAGANSGHMVCIKEGIVYDTHEPTGLSLMQYRVKYSHGRHIRKVWY